MEIHSTKNNVVEFVTAIVKTHERPEKLITMLASIILILSFEARCCC